MINAIGSDWKSHLGDGSVPTDRIYSDFRLLEYPDLETGSAVYSLAREDNLIDRGNCESTTAPMVAGETVAPLSGSTWARSADFSHTGDYSYKITKTGAGTGTAGITDSIATTTDMHGLVPGSTIEVSAYLYVPTGTTATSCIVSVGYYDSAAWTSSSIKISANDAWGKDSEIITIPSTATGFRMYARIDSAEDVNDVFYVDDVRLTSHNIPGSHYLSSGYTEHLLAMPDTFTVQIKFKPNFAHDIGSVQNICGWYGDGNSRLYVTYLNGSDQFLVIWQDGANTRALYSAQYDDGTAHRNINQYITLTAAIDLTTGDTTGSSLWMNKTQDDTTWSGAIDAKSTEFNKFQVRAYNTAEGDYDIAYVRFFSGLVATDAQVQNDFKDVKDEEIFFCLDGHGTGRSRCNITRFVSTITTTKQVENLLSGSAGANRCGISLFNRDNDGQGYFSDDQYAAFDPTADQFNGTVDQKYLQRRSNVTIENWYDGDFDTVFFGKVNSMLYKRSTQDQNYGTVGISCDDDIGLIARTSVEKGRYYEDADLVDTATESDSLLHIIARLATQRQVYNYLSNSSFENATIGNSWDVSGGTLSRQSDPLFGTYCGQLANATGATKEVRQTVEFDGAKKLNVGETYNFCIWLKSAGVASEEVKIIERDAGYIAQSTETYTLSGGEDFKKFDVSHTVTSSDATNLRVVVDVEDGETIKFDGAMLIRGDRSLNYFVLNDNDGVAGVTSADDAVSDGYDTVGFDAQSVAITHPWRRVDENVSLWKYLKDLGDSTIASYIGLSSAGCFRFRSRLATGYADPVPSGVLSTTRGIGTSIDLQRKNKIVVHGVNIVKDSLIQIMWAATASHAFSASDDGTLAETVAAGDVWPDPDTYGVTFIARYGDNDPGGDGRYADVGFRDVWEAQYGTFERYGIEVTYRLPDKYIGQVRGG